MNFLKIASVIRILLYRGWEQHHCKHSVGLASPQVLRNLDFVSERRDLLQHTVRGPVVTPLRQPQPIEDLSKERTELAQEGLVKCVLLDPLRVQVYVVLEFFIRFLLIVGLTLALDDFKLNEIPPIRSDSL